MIMKHFAYFCKKNNVVVFISNIKVTVVVLRDLRYISNCCFMIKKYLICSRTLSRYYSRYYLGAV